MTPDLPFIWAGIIAFAVLAYVVLDGFDLGIGILFPFLDRKEDRDMAMNSVAPVWDGNETWLILGGGGLMAVFPLAYATLLPALYAPIIAMLLGLVFRGVSFEFRARAQRSRFLWDIGFSGGSAVATLAQGITLGAIIQGIRIEDRAYAGGWWDWLTPFSLLTGIALLIGYALLGATWLNMKTDGPIAEKARFIARITGIGTFVLIGIVSLVTPFLNPVYMERWFQWPGIAFSLLVPGFLLLCAWLLFSGLKNKRERQPFLASLGLFLLCYIGIGISLYPHIIPPDLTIRDAAGPDSSLLFLLIGTVILVPIILAYTGYAYWIFRGKTKTENGYH